MTDNKIQALINLVTYEWRPLPLDQISVLTGKAPSQCGVVFRHMLGLMTEPTGGRNAVRGRIYVHDAYGHRFARLYRTSGNRGNGTRYWWRRFPTDATDAEILASALTLTAAAHFASASTQSPTPAPAPAPAPMPSLFRAPETLPAPKIDLAAEIAQAAATLDRLHSLRRERIASLSGQICALEAERDALTGL